MTSVRRAVECRKRRKIAGSGAVGSAAGPAGQQCPPRLTCAYIRALFALQVAVYLHHNAAHWLAIGGDVEEHSWIRHCSGQDWSRVTSGEGTVVARAEKRGTAADLLYITRRWAVKLSQSSMPQRSTDSCIDQARGSLSRLLPLPPNQRWTLGARVSTERMRLRSDPQSVHVIDEPGDQGRAQPGAWSAQ